MRDLFGDKVERAIELLKMYQPKDRPYYGCFSGGKDSCVIKEIARLGDINVVWHYNVTTIDPPELVRFIKHEHPDVVFEKPKEAFFQMAEKRGFPLRKARWCCEEYKERKAPSGSVLIMGVRKAESPRRSVQWKDLQIHTKTHQYIVSPILNWTDNDVWEFIVHQLNGNVCKLYYDGFIRLGCIGCPMSVNRKKELELYPHFKRAWMRLFQKTWERKDSSEWFGNKHFSDWRELFDWWLEEYPLRKDDDCQGILDMYSE